jgi:hypothetical protein
VHDIGDADGAAFISMEYVDGDTLANLLKQIGRLPGERPSRLRASCAPVSRRRTSAVSCTAT